MAKKWVPLHKQYKTKLKYLVSSDGECKTVKNGYIKNFKPNLDGYINWRFLLEICRQNK